MRKLAHEVVPHEAVEVVGRRGADVGLDVGDRRLSQRRLRERRGHARRLLQRRAFRQVHDDLELALVVEGEHLHLDEAERHQRDREEQGPRHAAEERPADEWPADQPPHDAPVDRREPVFLFVRVRRGAAHQPDGAPRRHDEGDDQGEHHRRRRAHRDGTHVRAHQAPDEGHRQDCRDDRQRGQDRRVADLVHRAERDVAERHLASRTGASAGRCSRPPRSRRRRGSRSRRSSAKSVIRLSV